MCSTLLFSRYAPPFSLSSDVKRWRYLADITCNLALLVEFVTSFVCRLPMRAFVACLCGANCLKSVCGMMAGAAGGPIDFYWAGFQPSNLPELSSKSNAQSTLSNGLGILMGAALSKVVSGLGGNGRRKRVLYVGYCFLTFSHLYCNAMLLKTIALNTINTERLRVIMEPGDEVGRVRTPAEVAGKEPLLFRFGFRRLRFNVGVKGDEDIGNDRVIVREGVRGGRDAILREGISALEGHYRVNGGDCKGFNDFKVKLEEAGWDTDPNNIQLPDEGWRVRVE